MIVDLRIYTARPGQLENFVALYRDHAWPIQRKYLGRCLGWYTTIEGHLNQVVHLWAYDSLAHRESARANLAKDPDWQAYQRDAPKVIQHMENRILVPAPFSPIK